MPNRNYWLQTVRQVADFLGIVAVLTTALIQIYPDILNHVDPVKILIVFLVILVFGALKGGIAHIQDKALRDTLQSVLGAVEQNLPIADRPTRRQRTVNDDEWRNG